MILKKKPARRAVARSLAGASLVVLTVGLAACSAEKAVPTPEPPAAVSSSPATSPAATPSSADGRRISLRVTGSRAEALVKTLVATANGKESDGRWVEEALPFSRDITLPASTGIAKILVLGRYPEGSDAGIACSIAIDGKEVATDSSNNRKPAECRFLHQDPTT